MLFKEIIGQETIKKLLISEAKSGRVSHAQLFCGPQGTGKLPLAIAYAQYLLCSNKKEDDACGTCHSCLMANKLAHPDLHFAFPVIKQKASIEYIDEWRKCILDNPYFSYDDWLGYLDAKNAQPMIYVEESDELIREMSLKSFEGGYKIAIIWLPEKMNENTANKLLKLIEEPPSQSVLILVSDEPDKILPTILSRTQRIEIQKLHESSIADYLENHYQLTSEKAKSISHLSEGNMTTAINLFKNQNTEDGQLFFDYFVKLMRLAYLRKIKEMKQWSEQLAGMGRERQKSFLEYCLRMMRENFIYNLKETELNYMKPEEESFASKFSPFVNEQNIQSIYEELNSALNDISRNVNSKIVFFDFSLKMIMLLKNNNR